MINNEKDRDKITNFHSDIKNVPIIKISNTNGDNIDLIENIIFNYYLIINGKI